MILERWSVDWLLFLEVALRRCDTVTVYPQQIVVCECSNGTKLSFVHGVPGANGLAAINFLQDKRKRRAMLEAAKIAVPKGATFTYGHGQGLASKFASTIGFPLALKPALGDNGVDAQLGIPNHKSLVEALDALATPPEKRAHHVQSSYRMMLLDEPKDVDGEVVVPGRYSFLIERHVSGRLYRLIVSGGKVVSSLLCEGSPSDGSVHSVRDRGLNVPPAVTDAALSAVAAIPGLFSAAVDVVHPRFVQIRSSPVVVDLHDRLGLWVSKIASPALAQTTAEQVFLEYARASGVMVPPEHLDPQDFAIELRLTDSNSLAALSARALELGLDLQAEGEVTNFESIEVSVRGDVSSLVDLVRWAFEGQGIQPVVSSMRLVRTATRAARRRAGGTQ